MDIKKGPQVGKSFYNLIFNFYNQTRFLRFFSGFIKKHEKSLDQKRQKGMPQFMKMY